MSKYQVDIKDPVLTRGEFGVDASTGNPTAIRLCGFDMEVAPKWYVPHDLAQLIYQTLALPDTIQRRQAVCEVNPNHRVMDPLKKNHHYWLQTASNSHAVGGVVGPGCLQCIQNRAMLMEDQNGRVPPLHVYEVQFSPELKRWLEREGFFVPPSKELDQELNTWGKLGLF